jgi:Glycosyl hydrolase family 92
LLSLTSPHDYAEIVENYIDGWRKNGWIPECRSNNVGISILSQLVHPNVLQVPGWTQGGSDGVNVLADFAVKYHTEAASLGVSITELYQALRSDGEVGPKEWNIQGRQIGPYK